MSRETATKTTGTKAKSTEPKKSEFEAEVLKKLEGLGKRLDGFEERISKLEGVTEADPKTEPKKAEPTTEPEKKPAKADPKTEPTEAETTAKAAEEADVPLGGFSEGPGRAYQYRDKNGFVRTKRDIFAARQASNGAYNVIWVWYNDKGEIVRNLTAEEIEKYCI